ncbi:isoleucine--tRNA ligase, cytoplasmic-like [Lineus longissimus]|uniref:isoleucine--tRNA ligase, cytoplasmic-like n=1 Tax=Lineus longissimus TaxID=88925 RepID=UPI002B4FA8FE
MDHQNVPDNISFPDEEEKIQALWKKLDAFQSCLKQSKNKPRYTFYDGPPFATGLPHYGHILAGTIKDIVTRWAHQSGFHVERRFGWDCHGLPVEYEIDKTLGIKGPADVAKMGIDQYNAECRKIVMRYAREWEEIVSRLGRWIDFKNDYKTMYPWFMESIWWNFKQLFDKGLVYRGFKVMPFSTACNTPLSNFEAGQDYKDVVDPAVIISFPLDESPEVSMIAWTTTPWTLPSNLALCVNPELMYVKVKDNSNQKLYIMMEARLVALFKTPEEYTILDRFLGKTLKGKTYKPLFPYFESLKKERGAFQVLIDGYVTEESGTGVVHQAPYFGEDDYRVSLANGIITKDMNMVCPVDPSGRFTEDVTHFKGMYVKDADKHIMKWLKENGRLVHQGSIKHSYPFCWRSETPLIYKAVPSWFVRVEHMNKLLLENNQQTYWVPGFVKEKRFANWLRDARDWAISRNRYWGTPIPLWVSDDGEEVVCIGSIKELEELTGQPVKDLHREFVDQLTIPSRCGKGQLKRVSEVFDCWFESGSMPYAQVHYPFENKKEFEDCFPADFIAEGLDQTRGWFYTLLVLSTALFGKPPFKNLIVNGMVLASDGQKMSKRKKNYPDPMEVVHKFGADALRMYLINSPVVRAESLRFKEEGVRDIVKDVFLPWYNAYRFLLQNIKRLEIEEGVQFVYNESEIKTSENYMDRWLLSFTQSLIKFVKKEMAAYRLYTVVPRLVKFVDQLTNWYVRMNRKRLKGDSGIADCHKALESLFSVLFSMTKVMAPFIPFLTEHMYQRLKMVMDPESMKDQETASIHFLMLPEPRETLIDTHIESAVSKMQAVIELGRIVRDRKTLPVKYPLKEVVVIHKDPSVLNDVKSLETYIKEELNIKQLTISNDKEKYGVQLRAEPDHKVLGGRLKGEFKKVMGGIRELTDGQLTEFQMTGEITVLGHTLVSEDLRVIYGFDADKDGTPSHYEAHSDDDILVLLDVTPDQSMLDEGIAREIINRVQKLRKKAKLVPMDNITVFYKATGNLVKVCEEFSDFIFQTIKQPMEKYPVARGASVIIQESMKIKNDGLDLTFVRRGSNSDNMDSGDSGVQPVCRFVNVEVLDKVSMKGTVLLENPKGDFPITMQELNRQVGSLFNIRALKYTLSSDRTNQDASVTVSDALSLHSKTLYAHLDRNNGTKFEPNGRNATKFVNVELVGTKPLKGAKGTQATCFLQNPVGSSPSSVDDLISQVTVIFGLEGKKARLFKNSNKTDEITKRSVDNVLSLHTQTLYASV